jgi:hypothetical protein
MEVVHDLKWIEEAMAPKRPNELAFFRVLEVFGLGFVITCGLIILSFVVLQVCGFRLHN